MVCRIWGQFWLTFHCAICTLKKYCWNSMSWKNKLQYCKNFSLWAKVEKFESQCLLNLTRAPSQNNNNNNSNNNNNISVTGDRLVHLKKKERPTILLKSNRELPCVLMLLMLSHVIFLFSWLYIHKDSYWKQHGFCSLFRQNFSNLLELVSQFNANKTFIRSFWGLKHITGI